MREVALGTAWKSTLPAGPLFEVLTRKQRIGTAIDRPEKRFAHTCALGRRSGCKGRNKESGRSVAVACRQRDVRKVEQRNAFQPEYRVSGTDAPVCVDLGSSERHRPTWPWPVTRCDRGILQVVNAILGPLSFLCGNEKARSKLTGSIC